MKNHHKFVHYYHTSSSLSGTTHSLFCRTTFSIELEMIGTATDSQPTQPPTRKEDVIVHLVFSDGCAGGADAWELYSIALFPFMFGISVDQVFLTADKRLGPQAVDGCVRIEIIIIHFYTDRRIVLEKNTFFIHTICEVQRFVNYCSYKYPFVQI